MHRRKTETHTYCHKRNLLYCFFLYVFYLFVAHFTDCNAYEGMRACLSQPVSYVCLIGHLTKCTLTLQEECHVFCKLALKNTIVCWHKNSCRANLVVVCFFSIWLKREKMQMARKMHRLLAATTFMKQNHF